MSDDQILEPQLNMSYIRYGKNPIQAVCTYTKSNLGQKSEEKIRIGWQWKYKPIFIKRYKDKHQG